MQQTTGCHIVMHASVVTSLHISLICAHAYSRFDKLPAGKGTVTASAPFHHSIQCSSTTQQVVVELAELKLVDTS